MARPVVVKHGGSRPELGIAGIKAPGFTTGGFSLGEDNGTLPVIVTEAELINAAIRSNCGAWMETHGKIWSKDRTKGLVTPRLNVLQRRIQSVVDRFDEREAPCRILGLKPRARGSTTMFVGLGYTAMRRTSTSAVFIGGQSDQTVGGHQMLKTFHANDRFNWYNTGEVNEKGAHFSNGSRSKKETAKDVQAGIGDTYTLLHCTEVARWAQYGVSNAHFVMANILKAIPLLPQTYIFLESTAETAGGDFFDRWQSATDAEAFLSGDKDIDFGSYCRIFAGWHEFEESALRLTQEQKNHIEATLDKDDEYVGERELIALYGKIGADGVMRLGEHVVEHDVWEQLAWRRYSIREECDRNVDIFNRDYPHCPEVAWMRAGKLRFNATGISIQRKRLLGRVAFHGVLEENKSRRVGFRQTEQGEAQHTIFEKPIPGRRYIVAVDPATGASQAAGLDPDNHGIFALRAGYYDAKGVWVRTATAGRVIPNKWEVDLGALAAWRLARYYGSVSGAMMVVEVNNDRGFQEYLKSWGANLFMREVYNRREQKVTGALGFQTNVKTREMLITTLASAIREWDSVGGIDIWCPHAVKQLENFILHESGRSEAGPGAHDDDIFAIALGLECLEHATVYVPDRSLFGPPDYREPPRVVRSAYS